MRTTLDIADDVLAAAKAIGKEQGKTAGVVLSELARTGLRKPVRVASRSGVPVLAGREGGTPVTLEIVNALRDEAP
jgi:hypothetical protein